MIQAYSDLQLGPDRTGTSKLKIFVVPALQLSDDLIAAWSDIQRSDPALANPFFRPEFTQVMAAVRTDVEVAVWEQGGEPVGFLPFERFKRRVGRPVGSHINEFQGAIVRPDVAWCPQDVTRAAGLYAWRFDHLAQSQMAFAPFQYVVANSPYLDLSKGFEHYRKSRGKSLAEILRRDRKAQRELGEVRLEIDATNRPALRQLLNWKIEQCRRTNFPCNYSDWVVDSLVRLLEHASLDFSGVLSSLYLGDRLAAVSFCLRSGTILHQVANGYDRELSQFGPGLLLAIRLAQMANSLGITRVDLGKGAESYKEMLASACDHLTEGAVHSQPIGAAVYRAWVRARDRLRSTRLRGPVRRVRRWLLATRIRMGYTE